MLFLVLAAALAATNAHSLAQSSARRKRLVGAANTTIEKYPYHVAIEVEGSFACSGAIISRRYVITAAHCINYTLSSMKVRSGTTRREKLGRLHDVAAKAQHESYSLNEYVNSHFDLGVVRLKQAFVYGKACQPIAIREDVLAEDYATSEPTYITGWGYTEFQKQRLADELQVISNPYLSKSFCNKTYETFGGIDDGQICAGHMGVPFVDTCQGDSGGPLVLANKIIGVLAYSEGRCGIFDYPTVYTELAYFRAWINKHVVFD